MAPRVSVLIPTFNRGQYLGQALHSVFRQTFKDYEVIVVDDGSTDDTREVVNRFNGPITYIRQKNQGISKTRNRALKESRGEYIAFLDSDDFWTEEKLELQVKVLDANPQVGIVFGRMPIINIKGETVGLKPAGACGRNFKELLEIWGDLPTSTVMTRRECFNQAGCFDETLDSMEDIDMWIRIARFYEIYEIKDKVLAYYRRHENQQTRDSAKVYEGLFRIFTKVYNNYPEARKPLMLNRIVENEYFWGKENYLKGRYKTALNLILEALSRRPWLGRIFFRKNDTSINKALKMIKPYGLVCLCLMRSLTK